ncbi:hypothetical protein EPUS_06151 [Endocarpon pusillum Z07020]|uniref:Fe2OG dioxygenase domain-containing protein n=1 Tax=Endocarpon pusillum (strain Z07020 / HMAS-L-300199) TaxID=1263415 RepID=U1I395_ENDPU|nr:uncharacterized protein EPUS_06151 [Endocarpon pusillum Z07020]ERF76489.1 hypothetical protein EPUS_06151 [Endocarpon pusillum Z07020]
MATTNGSVQTNDIVTLPVINISYPTPEIGRTMIDAAATHGFLYIDTRGTDFAPENVERQFELSKQFFSSPEEEKAACQIGSDNRGWTGMHSETLDPANQKRGDFKEAFNIGEFIDNQPQQPIPKSLQGHEDELLDFETRCRKTCHRILKLLALGLEIPDPDWFSSRHKTPSGCTLRLLHYPALPLDTDYQPEVDIRAGAHSDYGSITLLFQRPSQPGLEILTSSTTTSETLNSTSASENPRTQQNKQQKWSPVPVIPSNYTPETSDDQTPLPPILLNIGDLLSYWTNNLLKSTVHRVIFPHDQHRNTASGVGVLGEDRYSIAYFCHPTDSTLLEAVPSRLVPDITHHPSTTAAGDGGFEVGYGGGAGGAKVLTAKEHLIRRLQATYGFEHK